MTITNEAKVQAFAINNDGYQRIKKRGRIDIDNKWADDLESYWVEAIKSNNDKRFNTHWSIQPSGFRTHPKSGRLRSRKMITCVRRLVIISQKPTA